MTCKDCKHRELCYKENDYENFPYRCGDFEVDLCESCKNGDTCKDSDKGMSFAKHTKCWKYRYEGGSKK